MSFCKAQVTFPSNFTSVFSAIKNMSSLARTLYTFFKRSPLKCKFLRHSSECSGPNSSNCDVNFERTSQFFFKFCSILHNSSVDFKLIHFPLSVKGSHQSPSFETFECSCKNLPNSSCHFPNHKPVFLQILHHFSVS